MRVGADQRCKRPRTIKPRFDEVEFGLGQSGLRIEQFEQRKLARIVSKPCEPQRFFGLGDARTGERLIPHFGRPEQHPRFITRSVCIEASERQPRFCRQTVRLCGVDIAPIAITHRERDRDAGDERGFAAFAKAPNSGTSGNVRHRIGAVAPNTRQ